MSIDCYVGAPNGGEGLTTAPVRSAKREVGAQPGCQLEGDWNGMSPLYSLAVRVRLIATHVP